ncbi:PEP-CTERM sorting domain-containing protein [Phenylobacterium sp.]|uniref:PEP-CTERM sorting domain-containing protein n=1 Tax=Phenylobacterium sp. TaxID=1871053 RepID=UPI0011FBA910|nr:PEP-CTERM sorting domain-containing protein [Phenylobacterium sp.]THD61471.1 MAG: PEP-CTERM sorting domain-containing protein [Phenylobacterium sp.]
MNWKILIAGAAAAAALASSASAQALNFTFSSDLSLVGDGPIFGDDTIVPGFVTGTILGLQANGFDQQASDVLIDFVSPGVLGLPGKPFSLFDYANELAATVDPNIVISQNDFDVVDGQVVFAVFQIFGGYFDLNVAGQFNSMVSPDSNSRIQNLGGLGAVTFSVPEPEAWMLMAMGFGGLGALLRARRRTAGAAVLA